MSDASQQLEILYESGPCLVVNKPAGVLTQAPAGIDSMEVRIKEFYRQREGKEAAANIYLGLPHRLDRPVSGAIVFARHVRAAQRLAAQFEDRTVTKVYWAVVEGDVEPDEGTWTNHLHKRHGMAQTIVVPADDPRGKLAVMHWRALGRGMLDAGCSQVDAGCSIQEDDSGRARSWDESHGRPVTMLEIQLETGRTHQIRVQAASRGFPVLGDTQYGATQLFGEACDDERLRAIALHARQLAFRHPMIEETVNIVAPLSAAWNAVQLPAAGHWTPRVVVRRFRLFLAAAGAAVAGGCLGFRFRLWTELWRRPSFRICFPTSIRLPASPFRRLFVRLAAVVGLVKAAAFEHHGRAGAEQAAELGLAALGAFLFHRVADRLEQFERVPAGVAFVVVGGHGEG